MIRNLASLAGAIALLFAVTAHAQEMDPRIAAPMVKAQTAEIALREAVIRALQEDAQKRETDLAAWFKGWFGSPKAEATK